MLAAVCLHLELQMKGYVMCMAEEFGTFLHVKWLEPGSEDRHHRQLFINGVNITRVSHTKAESTQVFNQCAIVLSINT